MRIVFKDEFCSQVGDVLAFCGQNNKQQGSLLSCRQCRWKMNELWTLRDPVINLESAFSDFLPGFSPCLVPILTFYPHTDAPEFLLPLQGCLGGSHKLTSFFLLPVCCHLWRFDRELLLSLELHRIAFSLDYWWFSGELRHKHSIKNELLLLSPNLPWSKIICFPAGFQLHLLIIFHLLLKLWDVFLFHSIIFYFLLLLVFWHFGKNREEQQNHCTVI